MCTYRRVPVAKFRERGVGSGWRRGGMAEDLYVREDRRWYALVVLVGGYLLV